MGMSKGLRVGMLARFAGPLSGSHDRRQGAHHALCDFRRGIGSNGSRQAMGAISPEVGERRSVAEVVRDEGQHGLDAVRPEFLRPFHPPVDLFHCRFHVSARDRQSLFAVFGVIHSRPLILQVSQRRGDDCGRSCLGSRFGRVRPTLAVGVRVRRRRDRRTRSKSIEPICDTLANLLSKPCRS